MQAPNADHLFRSDAELEKDARRQEKAVRTAKAGDPITLGSKPLDLVIRASCDTAGTTTSHAYIAESGFQVRKLNLETGKTTALFKGHTGPVTSLAFYNAAGQSKSEIVFSGSWDKSIRATETLSKTTLSITPNAHTDFVKCLLVVPELRLLLSGGSDKDIRVWDLEAFSSDAATTQPLICATSSKAHHTRPIEVLASFPILAHSKETDENAPTGSFGIWSADSMGRITVWELDRKAQTIKFVPKHTWLAHETAIYDIKLVGEGEAWTASSDQLATCWSFDPTDPTIPPTATLRLPHPYYVKSILPLEGLVPGPAAHYVLTGSTDEQIRVWDTSLLDTAPAKAKKAHMTSAADASDQYKDGKKPAGLVADLEGHFHEVNRLALCSGRVRDVDEKDELYVISTGLDCTLRKWKARELVGRLPKPKASLKEVETLLEPAMTEEEERELAELMEL